MTDTVFDSFDSIDWSAEPFVKTNGKPNFAKYGFWYRGESGRKKFALHRIGDFASLDHRSRRPCFYVFGKETDSETADTWLSAVMSFKSALWQHPCFDFDTLLSRPCETDIDWREEPFEVYISECQTTFYGFVCYHREEEGNPPERRYRTLFHYHREDGPAIDGPYCKAYYRQGQLHRVGGPAILDCSGLEFWCLHGQEVPKEAAQSEKHSWWWSLQNGEAA